VIAQRILAVLSAALLVGAAAMALIGPAGMPFGQALLAIDHTMLQTLQSAVDHSFAPWLWRDVILPVIVRPAWLPPTALGLICAGLSLSLPAGRHAERPRQRRS
jgi:hypothetical protein